MNAKAKEAAPYQFRIWHLILATCVSAALLGWWKAFGAAWIGPLVLVLGVFLGIIALIDATPKQPLNVAKFFGSAVGLQALTLGVGVSGGLWFIVIPAYYPVYLSISPFTGGTLDFTNRPWAFGLQTLAGVLSYAIVATGVWAWWKGYASGEV